MQLPNLKTNFLGKNFIFYDEIDSTQNEIWRRIEDNYIQNGTLVMADIQKEGKGTHGRTWFTDETKNIAFSFYVKTNCSTKKLENLTIEIAQILIEVFKEMYNINLNIKKPNDITYNNKKIGGILTQSKINSNDIKFLVIGIGMNTDKTKFAKEIKEIATSIKKEFGINVNRFKVVANFCNRFEESLRRRIVV